MGSEHKPFPPSEQKLQNLRADGVFPKSRWLSTFFFLIGIAVGLLLMIRSETQDFYEWTISSWSGSRAEEGSSLSSAGTSIFHGAYIFFPMALKFLSLAGFVVIILNCLQTRFFFSLALLRLDFGRVFRWSANLIGFSRRLREWCLAVVVVIFLFFVGFLCLRRDWIEVKEFSEGVFLLFSSQKAATISIFFEGQIRKLIELLLTLFEKDLALLVGIVFLVGVISRVLIGISFRAMHGMTREEIEAENREGELAPELRQAVWESSQNLLSVDEGDSKRKE